jgi:hypothetical protein
VAHSGAAQLLLDAPAAGPRLRTKLVASAIATHGGPRWEYSRPVVDSLAGHQRVEVRALMRLYHGGALHWCPPAVTRVTTMREVGQAEAALVEAAGRLDRLGPVAWAAAERMWPTFPGRGPELVSTLETAFAATPG